MRETLKFFDPKLGKPLPPKNYVEDCSLTMETFSDKFDLFILSHFFGLMWKTIVIRNRSFMWTLSILWEIVEIGTTYFIPNFAE
eukprot:UN05566